MASFCNQIWRFPKMGLSHIIQKITMTIEIPWWFSWGSPQKTNKPRLNPWHGINSPSRHHQAPVTEKDSRGQNNKILSRWHPHYPDACPNNIPRKHPKKSYPHESEKWSLGWFFRFHIPLNHPNDHHQQWYSTIPSYHQSLLGWFIINSKWYLLVN